MTIGTGSTLAEGCTFDVGPRGQVTIGECTVLNDVCIMADDAVRIGDYALISWDVVIMDSCRWLQESSTRRAMLETIAGLELRSAPGAGVGAAQVTIGNNVWIGFGSIILPGVTIGDGSVIGCKSVVTDNVAPYSIYGGNPASYLRALPTAS